jgi:hypothetical protein
MGITVLTPAQRIILNAVNRFRDRCKIELTIADYRLIVTQIRVGRAPIIGFNMNQQNTYRVQIRPKLFVDAVWDSEIGCVCHLFGPAPIARPRSTVHQIFQLNPR